MNYNAVIAQEEIKLRLRRQVMEGRVPHAQLFCGPEGTGKLAMAMAFASALLCENPQDGAPCGQCKGCLMTAKAAHPDLHFVFPVFKRKGQSGDPVSDNYIREWREQLAETPYFDHASWLTRIGVENQQSMIYAAEADEIVRKLNLVAAQGGFKVMVVWLPELMNIAAANKLLKVLEEPMGRTAFVLVSNTPERLLTTIISRTQRIEFKPLGTQQVAEALMQRNALQADDAQHVARLSDGSYTAAVKLLQVNRDEALFFDLFVLLMRLSYMRKIKDMSEWADHVASWGRERQKLFLDFCQRLVRENFIYNFRRSELNYMSERESEFAVKFARFINERNVYGIMDELSAARRDIEQNVNPRMVFFDFALKMIVLLIQ